MQGTPFPNDLYFSRGAGSAANEIPGKTKWYTLKQYCKDSIK
jgi:hypothetical protein